MVAMIREADREPVSVVGKWARSRRSTHGASVSGAFRRTCGADEGAVGAVSALRLSSHPHLSRARRLPHEPWPGISAVAGCWPAVAAQASEEADRCCSAATATVVRAEPGMVL